MNPTSRKATFLTVFAALFLLNTFSSANDAIKEMLESLHQTCVEDSGVSKDVIVAANAPGDLPNDPNLKCYMKCLFEELGVLEGTTFDVDALVDMLPDHLKTDMAPMMLACKDEKGTDGCDLAFNLNNCAKKYNPTKYMLF